MNPKTTVTINTETRNLQPTNHKSHKKETFSFKDFKDKFKDEIVPDEPRREREGSKITSALKECLKSALLGDKKLLNS